MHPIHLADNPWLVGLILVYGLLDVLSWRPDGLMPLQRLWFRHVLSTRAFESRPSSYNLMLTLLVAQWFIFGGLTLYCSLDGDAAASLSAPTSATWLSVGYCVGAPAVWFVGQWGLFNWIGYLFNGGERLELLRRIYLAIHLIAAQAALVLFAFVVVAPLAPSTALFLLVALFILVQIAFAMRAFSIFSGSLGAWCAIILYLCALEIAPLAIVYSKVAG